MNRLVMGLIAGVVSSGIALTPIAVQADVGSTMTRSAPSLVSMDYYVDSVADSYLKACSRATVGEMADSFFGDPYWSSFRSTTGKRVVEVEGEMYYKNRRVTAVIQFIIKPSGSFRATYLGFNGKSQSLLMMSALFKKMCAST